MAIFQTGRYASQYECLKEVFTTEVKRGCELKSYGAGNKDIGVYHCIFQIHKYNGRLHDGCYVIQVCSGDFSRWLRSLKRLKSLLRTLLRKQGRRSHCSGLPGFLAAPFYRIDLSTLALAWTLKDAGVCVAFPPQPEMVLQVGDLTKGSRPSALL